MTHRSGRAPHVLVALLAAAGLLLARHASADASGCSRVSNGRQGNGPGEIPACVSGGAGCYECAYANANQPGYILCAESIDGSVTGCSGSQDVIPDWWPDPDPGDPGPPAGQPPDTQPPGSNGGDDGPGDEGGGSGDPPPDYLYSLPGPDPITSASRLPAHLPYRPHEPYQPLPRTRTTS